MARYSPREREETVDGETAWVSCRSFAKYAAEDLNCWRDAEGAEVVPHDPRRGRGLVLSVRWGRVHPSEAQRVLLHIRYAEGLTSVLSAHAAPQVLDRLAVSRGLALVLSCCLGADAEALEAGRELEALRREAQERRELEAAARTTRLTEAAQRRQERRAARKRWRWRSPRSSASPRE